MTIEYTIHKQTDSTAEVIFIDSGSGITHSRVINTIDCVTSEDLEKRIAGHLRAFTYRMGLSIITQSSLPSNILPADIIIDENLSEESKATIATVVEAKMVEVKESTEKLLESIIQDGDKPETVASVTAELANINTKLTAIKESKK